MTTMQQIVVGVFDERSQDELAVDELMQAGFSNDQIRYSGHGAATGGMLASLKSLFTGEETGGVYDDLVSLGVQQDNADSYQREFEAGRSIVAVQTNDHMQDARDILARYGGYGARTSSEQTSDYVTNVAGTDIPQTDAEGEQRLRKDVVSEQQSIDVPVMHEEVYIERRPGSGQPSDTPIGEDETCRIPVREEQVTVEKQPVVREEILLGKRTVQENQRVSDTVQREEAHVEREGDIDIHENDGEGVSG